MSDRISRRSFDDFIKFCTAAEEFNCMDFDERKLTVNGQGIVQYVGTYRDVDNFKVPYFVEYHIRDGRIEFHAGTEKCIDELNDIYNDLFPLADDFYSPPENRDYFVKTLRTVQFTLLKALTPGGAHPLMCKKAFDMTRGALASLENHQNAAAGSLAELWNEFTCENNSTSVERKCMYVLQGRNVFERGDIGWDRNFDNDQKALEGIESAEIIFDKPFTEHECRTMEEKLREGTAIIVKKDLVNAFGFNTLIKSHNGFETVYSLVTIVEDDV